MGALTDRPRRLLMIGVAVVVLAAGGLFTWHWHATKDERALRELVDVLTAQCLARSAISSAPDDNTASDQCMADRDRMLGR